MFGGNSTTEPITLAAKFSNIQSELIFDVESNFDSNNQKSDINSKFNNETLDVSNNETLDVSNNETLDVSDNQSMVISDIESNSGFELGITIGIIVGVAIGISIILIIKQKNT